VSAQVLQLLADGIEQEAADNARDVVAAQFAAVRSILRPALQRLMLAGRQQEAKSVEESLHRLQDLCIEAELDTQRRSILRRLLDGTAPVARTARLNRYGQTDTLQDNGVRVVSDVAGIIP
jgi:hypothetical protein